MVQISADSLFVRCGLAAAAYYLPQDLGVFAFLSAIKRSSGMRLAGPKCSGPPESEVDDLVYNFMSDRNFTPASYAVHKRKNFTVVQLFD
ncbi:hypothetical protein TpMuguga_02g00426 [Theileria parva strain Muguga]|uniref:Uncharacterized protein n=1 Tax=Theileria parva TaxID=5875 RepID=Q4N564_THEPA|nr:uncharacterized protein TpMuguga_02g00426 [Theileria parva strain Muguga]EAN32709.1 hypothetical protein TpMuguga_02g00426 [Theileria parva strain Muguga]|eukprot:XP_764992.1 hypothetical protein [Theileria parva strain Muguga]